MTEKRSLEPKPYKGKERRESAYDYLPEAYLRKFVELQEGEMKSENNTKIWILSGTLSVLVFAMLGVGGYLLANANDTLKNAVTEEEVETAIELRLIPREEISDMINTETAPEKVRLDGVEKSVEILTGDFKTFKTEQREDFRLMRKEIKDEFKEFNESQKELIELIGKLNDKIDKQP